MFAVGSEFFSLIFKDIINDQKTNVKTAAKTYIKTESL